MIEILKELGMDSEQYLGQVDISSAKETTYTV